MATECIAQVAFKFDAKGKPVVRSVRRILLHLPATFPWLRTWRQIARAVGATS